MAFDRAFLDELNARCDILDVVGRYVQLKKAVADTLVYAPSTTKKQGPSALRRSGRCSIALAVASAVGF